MLFTSWSYRHLVTKFSWQLKHDSCIQHLNKKNGNSQKFQCDLFLEVAFGSPKWILAIKRLLDTSGFTDKKNRPRGEVMGHSHMDAEEPRWVSPLVSSQFSGSFLWSCLFTTKSDWNQCMTIENMNNWEWPWYFTRIWKFKVSKVPRMKLVIMDMKFVFFLYKKTHFTYNGSLKAIEYSQILLFKQYSPHLELKREPSSFSIHSLHKYILDTELAAGCTGRAWSVFSWSSCS